MSDPPANVFPNLIVADGSRLTSEFVAKYNITHVINCARDEMSPAWFRALHPQKYVAIGAEDSPLANIMLWYPRFEEYVNKFLAESDGNIFVHCQCGINRSPILACIYESKKLKKNFMGVTDRVIRQRPCAFTNFTYLKQANNYIKSLLNSNEQLGR